MFLATYSKLGAIFVISEYKMTAQQNNQSSDLQTTTSDNTTHFGYKTIGYNFETEHFNDLLRENKKESDIMTFEFSKNLIKTLDDVRGVIGLEY